MAHQTSLLAFNPSPGSVDYRERCTFPVSEKSIQAIAAKNLSHTPPHPNNESVSRAQKLSLEEGKDIFFGIWCLRKVGLYTFENYKLLIDRERTWHIVDALCTLARSEVDLVTPENVNALFVNSEHAKGIAKGFAYLVKNDILIQEHINALMEDPEQAEEIAWNLWIQQAANCDGSQSEDLMPKILEAPLAELDDLLIVEKSKDRSTGLCSSASQSCTIL